MNIHIFIDFDGTIVDIWARYFAVFKDYFCLPSSFFPEYKRLKYIFPNDRELAYHLFHLSEIEINSYLRFKHTWLEDRRYLHLDTLLVNHDFLENFFEKTNAKILTTRNNEGAFMEQLDFLQISFLKHRAIVLKPQGIKTKYDWLLQSEKNGSVIMIGDSEIDLKAGTLPNSTAFFVKTGLRDHQSISDDLKHFRAYENFQDCLASIFD
jgi:phosphoglycolate phosphatase